MSLIDSFANASLTIVRPGPGRYVEGRYKPGTESVLPRVAASIQQATPREISLLPENRRGGETIVLFTEIELKIPDEGPDQTKGDFFVHKGKTYEVHKVEDWSDHFSIPHFKSTAVLRDDQKGADRG